MQSRNKKSNIIVASCLITALTCSGLFSGVSAAPAYPEMSNVKSALESQALFAGTNNARRIVIIDAAVKDTEVLLSAIDPAAQVFYLDA
ncbi:MAG: hypothetical protein KDK04_09595, partial [Candidatus Competibacteraceae bacterium]|nr:hypothetical protein [Candidatus Competibacteraceae bacterium]MCB1811957.1 hypothetical protein [Candidatus Competibacteraceae bacterium]